MPEAMALKTYDMDGVEIFAVGEWNGRPFSPRDLDTILESFQKTKDRLKPYVKLGHDDKQPILKSDGLPAAGWVEDLKRVGDKLVARLSRVPGKIKELIDAGAFRRVSVELIPKYRIGDQVYDMALAGLALLGTKTPAVDSLEDIIALYGADYQKIESEAKAETYVFDSEANAAKEVTMTVEVLQKDLADAKSKLVDAEARFTRAETELKALKDKDLAEAQAQVKEATDKFAASEAKVKELEAGLASEKSRADKSEAEVSKFKAEARRLEITSKVEGFIREKKLSPAQKDLAITLLEGGMAQGELKFSVAGKEYKTPEELLFALIGASAPVSLNDEEQTGAGKANRTSAKDGVVGEEFDRKVQEYAKEHKVPYRDAYVTLKREEAAKA